LRDLHAGDELPETRAGSLAGLSKHSEPSSRRGGLCRVLRALGSIRTRDAHQGRDGAEV